MRNPILSRLLVGGALAAALVLGVLAMRAALPTPEPRAAAPAKVVASAKATKLDVPRPVRVADATIGPVAPAADPAPAEAPAPEAKSTERCSGETAASSCPDASADLDANGTDVSRPTVSVDADAHKSGSSAHATRSDRRVSSGSMRMLGGGESTW